MKIGQFATLTPTWGSIQLSEHKFFEYQFEFTKFNEQPFQLSLEWTHRRDHAGIEFIFSIYKLFWICFSVYDHRHWDYENGCWANSEDDCSK